MEMDSSLPVAKALLIVLMTDKPGRLLRLLPIFMTHVIRMAGSIMLGNLERFAQLIQ